MSCARVSCIIWGRRMPVILNLGDTPNTLTINGVDTLTGGSGADAITLGAAFTTNHTIDLGSGSDKLTLASVANTGTLTNVETLTGGSAADVITIAGAISNASADLAAGNDKLNLDDTA